MWSFIDKSAGKNQILQIIFLLHKQIISVCRGIRHSKLLQTIMLRLKNQFKGFKNSISNYLIKDFLFIKNKKFTLTYAQVLK